MSRIFKKVDYDQVLDLTVRLGDCLPPNHLAHASKRKAVSYKHLIELETQLRIEVEELFVRSSQSEQPEVPDGLVVSKEITRRQDRLVRLAEAKTVLEARAKERLAVEQAEYETKLEQRKERERTTGRRVHPLHRPQDHGMGINTILVTQSHAS